jgi:hypothetical protein
LRRLKEFLRTSFPCGFALARNIFNICYVAIKWHYRTRNGVEAKYFRTCKSGELKLLKLWEEKNNLRNPLQLDILEITQLVPTILLSFNHFNPTIRINRNTLQVMWRVSDYTMPMEYNKIGKPRIGHTVRSEGENDFEGIISAELPIPFRSILDSPMNQEMLQLRGISNLNYSIEKLKLLDRNVFVEDPRLHAGYGNLVTAIARFGNLRPNANRPNHARMILINDIDGSGTIVHSDTDKYIEKNWVVIEQLGTELIMLKQSHPQEIVSVDSLTGVAKSITSSEFVKNRPRTALNGGSAFVLIDNAYYMRVARIQIPLPNLGITRISVIVMHDLSYREISRSKPFIFQKLGVEVCNGFAYNASSFIFSWGQDDKSMFIASCEKNDLLDWYYNNVQD